MRALTASLSWAALGALLLLPTLVRADAPVGQYQGYLSSDTIIKDLRTGLTWDRTTTAKPIPLGALRCVPSSASSIPTVKELATLLDNEPRKTVDPDTLAFVDLHVDQNAFPNTLPRVYWTSSVTPDGGVFVVDFAKGEIRVVPAADLGKTTAHLRCVTRF
jgi:hypothetical protein